MTENKHTIRKASYIGLLMPIMFLTIIFSSCGYESEPSFDNIGTVQGFRPIYKSAEEIQDIKTLAPKSVENPGKIYVYQNYLFINEIGEGVHVINNLDPTNPQPRSFIRIEGNVDISIKNNVLYADNYADLVALDISNIENIVVLNRIKNVFDSEKLLPPPQTGTYFECPDKSKGIVVAWEEAELKNPKCYR